MPLDSETLNTIFEVFEDWEEQCRSVDITSLQIELEEEIEEPKP